jgi:hypothetical protein
MTIDLRDRVYIPQFSPAEALGLVIYVAGSQANADGAVLATMVDEVTQTPVFTNRPATNPEVGVYEIKLSSVDTSRIGLFTITTNYAISGIPQIYQGYLEVGAPNPDYDNLDDNMKMLIESVWHRFADAFDSPSGGPNLQTYFQSHWSRGRVAQMARIAVGRLNTMAQPSMTYTLDPDGQFPLTQWGPLLETMTYIECLKHLRRSYVEQPDLEGGSVTRLNRRDYLDRWGVILADEEAMLKTQLDVFKIRHMGFGSPRVLVSGGVYGRYGPTRFAGSVAARPRYWTRFY